MEKSILTGLKPEAVFGFFEEMTRIPHGSGNTEAVGRWAAEFAAKRGLKHRRDKTGNVIIWKDASPGYEDHPPVILQGHLDMVCVKDAGSDHDFERDPLELYVESDWIRARGTSLGGDDGIAVAMAMAVLDDDSIAHPPLEAVFTVDEETGMTGARTLDASDLRGRCLINIDSEAEGVLTAGCAGGARSDITRTFHTDRETGVVCILTIDRLRGGHSGMDINKGRANANKLLADCLTHLHLPDLRLISFQGGGQDNAIPVRAEAAVLLQSEDVEGVQAASAAWIANTRALYPQDPGFTLSCTWPGQDGPQEALSVQDSQAVLQMLCNAPNGVRSMEPDLPEQVRTSLNLGTVRLEKGELRLTFCIRSSSGEEKERLCSILQTMTADYSASYSQRGDYPAWEYRKESRLREIMIRVFQEQYGRSPVVETVHAGLECGLLSEKMPGLDAVSIGPDMVDIHSAGERLSIASVQRIWTYLLEVLSRL